MNPALWTEVENAVAGGPDAMQRVRGVVEAAESIQEEERQMLLGRIDNYLWDFEQEAEAERESSSELP